MKTLIGFSGPAGVGKDTAANMAADMFFNCDRASFAYPIKAAVKAMGILTTLEPEDKEAPLPDLDVSARHCWQTLGTEWGRDLIHPDLWIIMARRRFNAMPDGSAMIFSDLRFENEAAWIREEGLVIHMRGPNRRTLSEEAQQHASEGGIEVYSNDEVIFNDKSGEEHLRKQIQTLMTNFVTGSL